MSREQMEARHREFWVIQELVLNDPTVRRIVDAYVHGSIATLNEALFQMVIHCCSQKDDYQKRLTDLMLYQPTFVVPEHLKL